MEGGVRGRAGRFRQTVVRMVEYIQDVEGSHCWFEMIFTQQCRKCVDRRFEGEEMR